MPQTGGLEYLIEFMFSAGSCRPMSSGTFASLSWAELKAWSEITETELTPFESQAIIDLSTAYANELNRSSGKETVAPYQQTIDRENISTKMKSALSMLARKKK